MFKIAYKGIAAALITMVAFTVPAMAQDTATTAGQGVPGAKRHQMGGRLMKELNLTPEQKEKIKAIQEAQKAKIQPIRDNAKLTPEEKKAQLKPIMKDGMKQIMALLTPEQKAKLKELREKRKELKEEKGTQPNP